ncbi:hemerythrin-like metal-binding protein [Caballeronia arvi]|uniref:Hemerythrin-like metal-binding protein n=2 Tax=Caballeronia arvi TaxID=1777135 RepID=A0A158KJA2_9BURK|nr:hemerythrin-like metal-binding protein [Caballeronia arvi]
MDDEHREFYDVTLMLLLCDGAGALAAIDAFEAHAIKHFGKEDEWMQATGFPPRSCHMDEHAAVLESVRQVRQAVADGRAGAEDVHDLGAHLFEWFPGHADYLDSALAAWMSKKTHGGKPVVLRRKLDL